MSNIDKTYHKLLNKVLKEGFVYEDVNRKDVKRLQIPHYTFKHKFKDGFPAITTKKLAWKSVVGELLWILKGDTNIKYLVDNGIPIWNLDAYNYYLKVSDFDGQEFSLMDFKDFVSTIKTCDSIDLKNWWESEGYSVEYNLGDLGKVYGSQWKNWKGVRESTDGTMRSIGYEESYGIDQISNLLEGLKEKPMSTQHIVNAWNPAELGQMALPPCHYMFQVLPEPLSYKERYKEWFRLNFETGLEYNCDESNPIDFKNDYYTPTPEYKFTLKFSMRSSDLFLGLPFNVASYALLAQIIGKMVNMVPEGIIGDLSNVHIYEPHLEAVKEQLKRDVNKYDSCRLDIDYDVSQALSAFNTQKDYPLDKVLNQINISDFVLRDYNSYPVIKAKMLPYSS